MRTIQRNIFSDPIIGTLAHEYQLLWIGIILLADDQGRLEDIPALIAAAVFPFDRSIDARAIDFGLGLLADHGKIMRYVSGTNGNGRPLIQIVKWWDHQGSAIWMKRSVYPAPPSWIDRIRTHEGHTVSMVNWDKVGGGLPDGGKKRKQAKANAGPRQGQATPNAGPAKAINDRDRDRDRDREDEGKKQTASLQFFTRTGGKDE